MIFKTTYERMTGLQKVTNKTTTHITLDEVSLLTNVDQGPSNLEGCFYILLVDYCSIFFQL